MIILLNTIILIILFITIWQFPIFGLYLIIFCAFFIDWFTEELGLLPHYYTWIIEYLICVLGARILIPRIVKMNFKSYGILKYVLIIVFIGGITSLVNGYSLFRILLGARIFIKYIILFLIIVNFPISNKGLKSVLLFMFALIIIQLPIAYTV